MPKNEAYTPEPNTSSAFLNKSDLIIALKLDNNSYPVVKKC